MPRITHILNQEVAEVDGHMYHLLEAETELSITKRLLSGITAPALALCGQWEEAVERLAIDLTEEKSITRTALQLQLIPALDPTKKNNVWTGVLTKGIKEQL
ncbi:MAG: hypothetical protein FJZ58_06790, partial [Chlamydiae bacterium]|nr:hypothetical protein [Chlamydiota bacterium]